MKLIAKRAFSYGGSRREAGDVFDAPPRHARVLMYIKHAEEVTSTPVAEDVEGDVSEKKPRKYKRRDLTAEK